MDTWPSHPACACWTSHSKFGHPFTAITASTLLWRLSSRCWRHSNTRALVRWRTDVKWGGLGFNQCCSSSQRCPAGLRSVQDTSCHRACFVHRSIEHLGLFVLGKITCNATGYKGMLDNCVLSTEHNCLVVMVRCLCSFGHLVLCIHHKSTVMLRNLQSCEMNRKFSLRLEVIIFAWNKNFVFR